MLKITSKQLKDLGACESGLKEFEEAFPNGFVARSLEEAKRKVLSAAHLDYYWAAKKLLKPSAREAYKKAREPIWEAFAEARESALSAAKICEEDVRIVFITLYWEQEHAEDHE